MKILGIDIGTTTITALLLDASRGNILKSCTLKNDSFISGRPFEKLQSPQKIIETVKTAIEEICGDTRPDAIGVTGQMHGILYLDGSFAPCSPLMIWQDERGNEFFKDNLTYAQHLTAETGIKPPQALVLPLIFTT